MSEDAAQPVQDAWLHVIRKRLVPLRHTPLHPQWLIFRHERAVFSKLGRSLAGRVLDIGCADRRLASQLAPGTQYLGLDYPDTAIRLYATRPDVFGDAQRLPFPDGSFESVAMLDVLEHLPAPDAAVAEAARVLVPGGLLAISVPFLYPLHDQPYDFQRWTRFGLRRLVGRYGLQIAREEAYGKPVVTAALLANIASARAAQQLLAKRSPWAALHLPLAAISIPLRNLLAFGAAAIQPTDDLMPLGYQMLCRKPTFPDDH